MAVVNDISEKIVKWLRKNSPSPVVSHPAITAYNPEIIIETIDTPPYRKIIHERVYSDVVNKIIHLRTIVEYDQPSAVKSRTAIKIYPQEHIED